MKLYFAPMEGITGYVFRNAHHHCFGGVDRYYTPFIATHKNKGLTSREKNDVLPKHNEGMPVVPQLLSNNGEDFIKTARMMAECGYREVNLNLGCPSKTVVTKQKGAGFLAEKDRLDAFLDQIYSGLSGKGPEISIKTRIGMETEEEWEGLLALFHQYPVKELIIHPRVQREYYNGTPHRQIWGEALKKSRNPVCYNGDLFTVSQIRDFTEEYPDTQAIMLGRGMLMDPALAEKWKSGEETGTWKPEGQYDYARIRDFHEEVYEGYRSILSGDRDVLFKMKELWWYLIQAFPQGEKTLKKIRKAERLSDYERAVEEVFMRTI